MAAQLTPGAVLRIYKDDTSGHPILQVVDLKKIQNNSVTATSDRYRLMLSDGHHLCQSMLGTQLNSKVLSHELQQHCIVRLNDFVCNTISGRKIIIILSLDVLNGPVPVIGSPEKLDPTSQTPTPSVSRTDTAATAAATAAAAHQPPYPMAAASNGMNGTSKQHPSTPTSTHTQANSRTPPDRFGSTLTRGGSSAVSRTPSSSTLYPIKALNPFQNRWTIKARVTSKTDLKSWSNAQGRSGKVFSVDLLDSEGGELRGTFFSEAADKFFGILQVDKVYTFSKGTLKPANRQYSTLNNEWDCVFDQHTEIVLVPDEGDIQKMKFSFIPIASLSQQEPNSTVDIIGVVHAYTAVSSIMIKSSQQERLRRTVTLLDQSRSSIELTIWGDKAQSLESSLENHPIFAIKGARVTDYNGRSLSTINSSYIELNPDLPESIQLRAWYDNEGRTESVSSLSAAANKSVAGHSNQRKTLSQIKDENIGAEDKPVWFTTKVTVTYIKHDADRPIWYMACPTEGCNKKVMEQSDGWHCESCQKSYPDAEPRYILSISANDATGTAWFNGFNDVGLSILNKSARELKEYKDMNDMNSYEATFADAVFRTYTFNVRAKLDAYMDDKRVRLNIMNATPIDFVQESRTLIEEINRYSTM
eukprot:GILK01013646.1.p1 GENE.GILK01013646.1~~GILK01013646.1.p1  ORF type:complete len:644 (+),score=126.93 GILK01013646.1:77-2008(+)